jgi:AbiV family abortive infection protein
MAISSRYILKGAWYAIEQAGHLLNDAAILYRRGRLSTAAGLALLAREELGKGVLLLGAWKNVAIDGGHIATRKELQKLIQGHAEKQERGTMWVALRGRGDDGPLDRLLSAHRSDDAGVRDAAAKQLHEMSAALRKRLPDDRHGDRLKAFYVDPTDEHDAWDRPIDARFSRPPHDIVVDAISDYAAQRFSLLDQVQNTNPPLAEAIATWTERPILPMPPDLWGDGPDPDASPD